MSEELVQIETRRSPHITRSIDNTALDAYMRCPRLFYYSMVRNRRKGGATAPALAFGSAWHKTLEYHYKSGGDYETALRAGLKAWQPHGKPDDHRTPERLVTTYEAYVKYWGEHDEEAKRYGKTVGFPDSPLIEVPTEIAWPAALHPYAGKIDRVFEQNGLYYVEDHKTTSQMGAYYFHQFDPSNQMMGYAWLAQLLTGLPIAGIRINACAVLKTQTKFDRQIISFSQDRLKEWGYNYNAWIQRLEGSLAMISDENLKAAEAAGADLEEILLYAFPHNFNACAGKYGQCAYTEVCTTPSRLRERVLEADFEENPWDPMEALDDE